MALQDELRAGRSATSTEIPSRAAAFRWDLAAAWVVILLPALATTLVLALRQRIGDLEERLVRDANALVARTHPRPAHVDTASSGSIGDAAQHHLPAIAEVEKRLKGQSGSIREVVAGSAPAASLPQPVLSALREVTPELDALLEATRTEQANFPRSLGIGGGWYGAWKFAAVLAGVRVRLDLEGRNPTRAVTEGLDALALGRDVAIARSLVGHMTCASIASQLAPAIASAIDSISGTEQAHEAVWRLRRIRDALPSFVQTLRDDVVYTRLYAGDVLSPATRDAIDPRARDVLRDGLQDTEWWKRLVVRDALRDLWKAQDAAIAAFELPADEQTHAWEAINDRLKRLPNPFGAISFPDYMKWSKRAQALVRKLDALVLVGALRAFANSQHRWPGSVDQLAAVGELTPDEATRLRNAVFVMREGLRGLDVVVPLPTGDDRDPRDFRFTVAAGRGWQR